MKKIILSLSFVLIAAITFGQMDHPATWSYEAKKKAEGVYDIVLTADISNPWHIYSSKTPKGGPIPTTVVFKPNPLVTKSGAIQEVGKQQKVYEKLFGVDVLFYEGKVQWIQTVKVKGNIKTNVSGSVEYILCDDGHCLPPTKKTFDLKLQ